MSAATVDLVEREAELARIRACVDAGADGRGAFLAVVGEPGIGKTALLDAGVAAAHGLTVLTARASELERGFPFGVVRQAFERVSARRDDLLVGQAALARAALSPAGREGPAATEATLHGLYWLLAALADEQPVLLAVDDAHWADEESLAFLRFLAVRMSGMRVAVLVTARPPQPGDAIAQLLGDPAVEVCAPRAFDRSGVADFVARRLARAPDEPFAEACHAAVGGNPFLLDQLVEAIRAEAIEPTAAQAARIAELRPEGLTRTLVGRLERDPRALAVAVAVLGDEVDVGLASALAGLDPQEAERAADALAAAGVLADRRPLSFRHALLRAAVLGGMRAGERARAHAAAVDLLRARGADAERLSAHLLVLEPRGNPADAQALCAGAAEALARGAPASAAALLERALREALSVEERAEVLVELGRAEVSLARPTAVERLLEAVRTTANQELRTRAALLAGRAVPMNASHLDTVLDTLEALQPSGSTGPAAVEVMSTRLVASWPDMKRSHAIAIEAAALLPLSGATPAESMLLSQLARNRLEMGAGAAEVSDLLDGALRHPNLENSGYLVPVAIGLVTLDRLDEADRLAERAFDLAVERGELLTFHIGHTWQGRVALARGDLVRAEELVRVALATFTSRAQWWAVMPVALLVETLVEQGRVDEIAGEWEAAGLGDTIPAHRALNQLLHARARWRWAAGDPERGLQDLEEIVRRVGPAADGMHWLATRLRTAELLHQLGREEEALTASTAAVELTRAFGAAGSHGWALRVHGRVTGDRSVVERAVDLLAGSPLRLEHARALIDLGAALRRGGERQAAREPLRAGHDLAVACGAAPDAALARAELAASGVHVERLAATQRDELTPSERRIAGMAAAGSTNKEIAQALFLTVKTVEMHLSSVYRKLDVRSRRDLPAALGSPSGAG